MPVVSAPKPDAEPAAVSPDAVKEQLHRLLTNSLFNNSRRYPGFLSYVVQQSLTGNRDQLKERTIGIKVFGRAPDYDLNVDPVVRVTAGEVRKRLAQYYYAPEHHAELRIELHPGSYIPEFQPPPEQPGNPDRSTLNLPAGTPPTPAEATNILPAKLSMPGFAPNAPQPQQGLALPTTPSRRKAARWLTLCLTAVLLAASALLYRVDTKPSALDAFWTPVLRSAAPVMISVGSWGTTSSAPGTISIGTHAAAASPVALADTVVIADLQQFLARRSKPLLIQTSTQTSFYDLQRGTTILISAFDNQWTMRLINPLRFHFVAHDRNVLAIEDRENPQQTAWQIDTSRPYATLTRDYGIIARFQDPTTEQMIVVAAGIGENGTIAAGQALTNPHFLQGQTALNAPAETRNIEAVVETTVIDGKSGPPRIVALTTW